MLHVPRKVGAGGSIVERGAHGFVVKTESQCHDSAIIDVIAPINYQKLAVKVALGEM